MSRWGTVLVLMTMLALCGCSSKNLPLPKGVGTGSGDLKAPPKPCAGGLPGGHAIVPACVEVFPPSRTRKGAA